MSLAAAMKLKEQKLEQALPTWKSDDVWGGGSGPAPTTSPAPYFPEISEEDLESSFTLAQASSSSNLNKSTHS
jgi:hypothetical protein